MQCGRVGVGPCKDYVVGREGNGRGREGGEGEEERGIGRTTEVTVKYSKTRCSRKGRERKNEASALRISAPGSTEQEIITVYRSPSVTLFF